MPPKRASRQAAAAASTAAASAEPAAAASPPPTHQRQWTHTTLSGDKEQRLHRSGDNDAAAAPGDDAAGAVGAAAAATAAPASGGRAKRRQQRGAAGAADAQADEASQQQSAAVSIAPPSAAPSANADAADTEMTDAAAASEKADATAAPAAEAPNALVATLAQFASYAPAHDLHSSLPLPPFELFAATVAHLRAAIHAGETHVQRSAAPAAAADADAADMNDGAAAEESSSEELRALLHRTRVHFARCYPLPASSWLEWLEDVQSLGSGVEAPAAVAASTDDSAEAAEAREDAAAASEQLFLVSLFRVALTDYSSPQLWDAFLSYITRAADSVLKNARAVKEYRALSVGAIYPRGVLQELRRRADEKKAAARAKKAAAQSGAASKKQAKAAESKEDERSDAEDSSSSGSDSDDSDDDEEEEDNLWSDDEDDEDESDAAAAAELPSPFSQLHPALAELLPLPYSRTSATPVSALPSPVPVCHSYAHGDSIFQKLRAIEVHLLTRMMQQAQREQNGQATVADESAGAVDEDDLVEQIERITRLYRLELTVPLKGIEEAQQAFVSWQNQQGMSLAPKDAAQFEYTQRISQTLDKKFESKLAALEAAGTMVAGVGVLSPEAQALFTEYVDFLSGNAKARARCKANPCQLMSVLERVVAVGFLDVSWWLRFVSLAREYAPRGVEGVRGVFEVAQRALRNCPWDARVASSFFVALEALQEHDKAVTRAAVEETLQVALNNPSLAADPEGSIELRLQVVGYMRRTVLAGLSADQVSQADALAVRAHFLAIRGTLPYLSARMSADRVSDLVSRVYACWVEVELRYLCAHLGDGVHEDAQADEEAAAHKSNVSLQTHRARQLFQQYVDDDERGSVDVRPWLDWVAFECRELSINPSYETFVRSLFRQGVDRITTAPSFSIQSVASLQLVAPLLQRWIDFEQLHGTLAQLQHAQTRSAKYMDALRVVQAQEVQVQQQQAAQAWQAAQDNAAASEESAPASWLSKPVQSKRERAEAKKQAAAEAKASDEAAAAAAKSKKTSKPKAATGDGAASAAPHAKKRKRDSGDAAAAAGGADEPASKRSHKDAAAAAPAAATAAPPPHTLFLTHLSWTLRDADLRALLSPFGSITRLASHKASKTQKTSYVEVTFSNDEEASKAEQALQGKDTAGGKKIEVARHAPGQASYATAAAPAADGAPAAAAAGSPASAAAAAAPEVDPLSVFVKNLPEHAADLPELVRVHFEATAGSVQRVDIPAAKSGHGFRNFCTVYFSTPEATKLALGLHGSSINGSVLGVVPNQAPARAKKLAAKIAGEVKRKPAASTARLFVPRAAVMQAHAATANAPPLAAADGTGEAAPITSNDDFRARLLAAKK